MNMFIMSLYPCSLYSPGKSGILKLVLDKVHVTERISNDVSNKYTSLLEDGKMIRGSIEKIFLSIKTKSSDDTLTKLEGKQIISSLRVC